MSKDENAKTDPVLRDDELDLVSGGSGDGLPLESISFNYWGATNPTTVGFSFGASKDRGFSWGASNPST